MPSHCQNCPVLCIPFNVQQRLCLGTASISHRAEELRPTSIMRPPMSLSHYFIVAGHLNDLCMYDRMKDHLLTLHMQMMYTQQGITASPSVEMDPKRSVNVNVNSTPLLDHLRPWPVISWDHYRKHHLSNLHVVIKTHRY